MNAIAIAQLIWIVCLKEKIPPMPVTRFMLREHLFDSGLAMNLGRVEKWNPVVIRIP
jgi:hypothetical protein